MDHKGLLNRNIYYQELIDNKNKRENLMEMTFVLYIIVGVYE